MQTHEVVKWDSLIFLCASTMWTEPAQSLRKHYQVKWWQPIFSRKTFRRRVLQKIVCVCHTMHINKHHSIHVFSIRIHSTFNTYPVNTYPTIAYPVNTYPRNTQDHTYPFNAYPFKRYASAGIEMYANAKHTSIRIHSIRKIIRIHSMRILSIRIHSKGLHQQEWQCMWTQNISLHIIASAGMAMSMSIIACHFISLLDGGNGNKIQNFALASISLQLYYKWIYLYRARMNMEFIAS